MHDLTPDYLVALYESPGPAGDFLPLRQLSQVDWSSVEHAHGAATDVPALLRALVSDNPDHREFAYLLLCETIWHQGDVYEATSRAVPFLYNLLETDGRHDKAAIARLIAAIADGRPPTTSRCEGDSKESEKWRLILTKAGRNVEREIAGEREYMAELRRQLDARFSLVIPYLDASDQKRFLNQ